MSVIDDDPNTGPLRIRDRVRVRSEGDPMNRRIGTVTDIRLADDAYEVAFGAGETRRVFGRHHLAKITPPSRT